MIIRELTDLTNLQWSKVRRSSGTAGSLLKAYDTNNGRKIYYKLSDYNFVDGIVGHECINEIIVDYLLSAAGIPHLSYNLIHANVSIDNKILETYLCSSLDFKETGESKIAFDLYYETEKNKDETPLDFCKRIGFEEYVYTMLAIDFIILNRDRHGANIEIVKTPSSKSLRPAPLFDHGLSLILENDFTKMDSFDITASKKVQCFFGSSDPSQNLLLIPKGRMPIISFSEEQFKEKLFSDLDGIVPASFLEKTFGLIKYRWNLYESIRNQK